MTLKTEGKWLILIALTAFLVFANSLNGPFVYDDKRQILMNSLIQEPSLYGKALTLDVWAFKGDGSTVASNYWRPTFTAWCILNFWLFGASPLGWHLLNIVLHMGVCLLAYLLLRRWGLSQLVSFIIALIFAVHPIHTESVAWIAGSPDLLFGIFFLASLWFAGNASDIDRRKSRTVNLAIALVFYLLALGAKEVALFCFPVYYLIFSKDHADKPANAGKSRSTVTASAVKTSALFVVAAVGYFIVRWVLLGRISMRAEDAASAYSAFLSAPEIFAFYLRQIVFPYWMGPNYWLRPVESAGFLNLAVPLIVSLFAVYCLWFFARRSFVQKLGAALFILPLIPIFNITAFLPEQVVHDRYLYLPLLGFLMMVVPFVGEILQKYFGEKAERFLLAAAVVISILLAIQTFLYNRVWTNELALWQHAVVIDPDSSFNWAQLGAELTDQNRTDEAINAYTRSLSVSPRPLAYIGRAQNLIIKGDLKTAIDDLRAVLETPSDKIDAYALYQAYETFAVALQSQRSLDEAEKVIRDGRKRLPMYYAALTEKLAVILYNQNRKQDALDELEAVTSNARRELLPASKSVFLRLGMLYAEQGNKQAAIENLNLFLQTTNSAKDKTTDNDRRNAMELLRRLKS